MNSITNTASESTGQSGQAVILLITAMGLFMIGALGLAIDSSTMFAHRQMAQAAADAAAQAAIMSIFRNTNSTSSHPFTAATFTCAVPPAALDLRTPCVYAQANGFGTAADTVIVTFPATVTGVPLSAVAAPAVSVSVQRTLNAGLIRFVGPSTYTVIAKSTAGIVGGVPSQCVWALDPSGANALQVNGGSSVTLDCGIIVNSTNADAATFTGGSTLNATSVDIVGGDILNGGAVVNPAPNPGAPAVSDPFASVASPVAGACLNGGAPYHPGFGNFTLVPGTYCGGITIDNGATATFGAGVYIILGGGVHFAGGATITGSAAGETFYLTGTNSTYGSAIIDNGVTVTLSAQTSGPYAGLLFYQDRSITSNADATFAGGATLHINGSLYFPTTNIDYSNGSGSAGYNTALVGKRVNFTGGASVNIKFDSTGVKTGLVSKTVAMVR